MKSWIQRTFVGLFGATVLFGGLAACSHRPMGPGMAAMTEEDAAAFKGRMIERVGRKLDLDATQKDRLSVLADKLREQRQALMAGGNPRADLQALVAGTTFDRARAQNLVTAKTEAIRAKSPEVIAAAADFYDSLRPEQQQQVRDMLQQRGRGWWGHRPS